MRSSLLVSNLSFWREICRQRSWDVGLGTRNRFSPLWTWSLSIMTQSHDLLSLIFPFNWKIRVYIWSCAKCQTLWWLNFMCPSYIVTAHEAGIISVPRTQMRALSQSGAKFCLNSQGSKMVKQGLSPRRIWLETFC